MTGFKLRTSGVGSNRSANWATTTAQAESVLLSIRLYGQSGSHGFLKSFIACLVFKLSGQASLTAVSAWPIFISLLIALLPEPLSNSHPAQGPIPWNFTDP